MTPYEMMLSESQERMLLVAERGREQEVLRVFAKWGLDAVEIGHITDDGLVRVLHHGKVAAEIPAHPLAEEGPVYKRPLAPPAPVKNERLVEFSAAGKTDGKFPAPAGRSGHRVEEMDLGTVRLHGAHEHARRPGPGRRRGSAREGNEARWLFRATATAAGAVSIRLRARSWRWRRRRETSPARAPNPGPLQIA